MLVGVQKTRLEDEEWKKGTKLCQEKLGKKYFCEVKSQSCESKVRSETVIFFGK